MGTVTVGSAVKRGAAFPIQQARDEFQGSINGERGTRTVRVDYDPDSGDWTGQLPAIGEAHPAADWLVFTGYSLRQLSGTVAELVLNYETPPDGGDEFSFGDSEVPDDEVTEDASIERIDITRHPNFHAAVADWGGSCMADYYDWGAGRICHLATLPEQWVDISGQTVDCPKAGETVPAAIRGMDAYLVGTGTVTVVEWSRNQPSNVIPDAGKRGKPTGYAGTVDYWLIVSGSRRRSGAFWQRVITYQYSGRPISGVVYEDAEE